MAARLSNVSGVMRVGTRDRRDMLLAGDGRCRLMFRKPSNDNAGPLDGYAG